MAILTNADRIQLHADVMRDWSSDRETFGGTLTKADLQAAINAVDQWVSDNAAAYNLAIPQPARNTLTASQKAKLLLEVVRRRYVKGV